MAPSHVHRPLHWRFLSAEGRRPFRNREIKRPITPLFHRCCCPRLPFAACRQLGSGYRWVLWQATTVLHGRMSPGKGETAVLPRAGHSARFSISGRQSAIEKGTTNITRIPITRWPRDERTVCSGGNLELTQVPLFARSFRCFEETTGTWPST